MYAFWKLNSAYGTNEFLYLDVWHLGSVYCGPLQVFLMFVSLSDKILNNLSVGSCILTKKDLHIGCKTQKRLAYCLPPLLNGRNCEIFYQRVIIPGRAILQTFTSMYSRTSDYSLVRPLCHTGAAYSIIGLTFEQNMVMMSFGLNFDLLRILKQNSLLSNWQLFIKRYMLKSHYSLMGRQEVNTDVCLSVLTCAFHED